MAKQTWKFPNAPRHEKTCIMPYANNKIADHPAHPHNVISVFVIRSLDSEISTNATSKS